MADQQQDPKIAGARVELDALDAVVLQALNRRVELVRGLHAYKAERGYPIADPGREETMVRELQAANAGPCSDETIRDLVTTLLRLTRVEVARSRDVR